MNRSMHAYITDNPSKPFFTMIPSRSKPNLKLLFAVTSAPGSFMARQGVRTSWGSGADRVCIVQTAQNGTLPGDVIKRDPDMD